MRGKRRAVPQGDQDARMVTRRALKFSMPAATIAPYDAIALQAVETAWFCACVATRGQFPQVIPNGDEAFIYMAGQAFAVGIPNSMYYPTAQSNAFVLAGAQAIVTTITAEERAWLTHLFPHDTWYLVANATPMTQEDVKKLIECLAVHMSAAERCCMINIYIGIFLAYTQQGAITLRKLEKIRREMQTLQMTITLTPYIIRKLWDYYGPYFDEKAAVVFLPKWRQGFECIPDMLRLRLLFRQTANIGLTGLCLVREMLQSYPNFYWDRLAGQFPRDWAAFQEAHRLVGSDTYYGYKKDLGIVSVSHYTPIVYCAKQLKRLIQGDENMTGWIQNGIIANRQFIDCLIQDFKAVRIKELEQMFKRF